MIQKIANREFAAISIDRMRFNHIETTGMLRGRKIVSTYSYRTPVDIHEVRRIDAALVRAFGNDGSRTIATPTPYEFVRRRTEEQGWDHVTGAGLWDGIGRFGGPR